MIWTLFLLLVYQPPVFQNLPNTTEISEDLSEETELFILTVTDPTVGDVVTCSLNSIVPTTNDLYFYYSVGRSSKNSIYLFFFFAQNDCISQCLFLKSCMKSLRMCHNFYHSYWIFPQGTLFIYEVALLWTMIQPESTWWPLIVQTPRIQWAAHLLCTCPKTNRQSSQTFQQVRLFLNCVCVCVCVFSRIQIWVNYKKLIFVFIK